jgi:predicted dehydrogenase
MNQPPLRTAILGLTEQGRMLLECAAKTNLFKIEAVADKDGELAQKFGRRYDCRHYDDYRLAVMPGGLDVVFAAAPLHTCAEYIHAALDRKLHILKVAPPARTFNELAEFVRQANDAGVSFAVSSNLRFSRAYTALREYLEQNCIEDILLVTARCSEDQSDEPWQRDPKLAGGGVLLCSCYELLDQLIQNFGTPDEVYSVHTSHAPDRQQRLYVTEDTAVVTMKFSDTLTANIIASNTLTTGTKILEAYGRRENILVENGQFSIFDNQNKLIKKISETASISELTSQLLANFAESIADPVKTPPLSSGTSHFRTMAVIESAYLSARTGSPESPARVLQMSQNIRV